MRYTRTVLWSLFLCSMFSCGQEARDWKNDFVGSWKAATQYGNFYEQWWKEKKTLKGRGFEINQQGDTIFGEKLELLERGEQLVYVAYPGNNRRIEFVGKRNEEGRYIFENAKNDFPSVIEYIFSEKKLTVNLKGEEKGKKITQPLNMVKEE